MPSRTLALTGWSAWKSPRAAGDLHLRRDVAVLEAVDLVQRDHDRDAEREDAPRDEPVARADPVARREDEEHDVDVLERAVHRLLHALGERVHRPLEARQVDEHELPVVAVRDAEDPPPGRVRHGRGDRDLLAGERVDERRLADVRPTRDGDEADLHAGRSGARRSGRGRPDRHRRRPVAGRTHEPCLPQTCPNEPAHARATDLLPTSRAYAGNRAGQRQHSAETVPVAPQRRRHGRHSSNCSGRSSSVVISTMRPPFRKTHPLDLHLGEPLAAAAARRGRDRGDDEVAGRYPSTIARENAVRSAQTPSG